MFNEFLFKFSTYFNGIFGLIVRLIFFLVLTLGLVLPLGKMHRLFIVDEYIILSNKYNKQVKTHVNQLLVYYLYYYLYYYSTKKKYYYSPFNLLCLYLFTIIFTLITYNIKI